MMKRRIHTGAQHARKDIIGIGMLIVAHNVLILMMIVLNAVLIRF
jgi:hypothetical protein